MTAGSKAGSEVTTGGTSTEKRVEKVADALVFAFIVTVQLLAIPLHAPPQPEKPQAVAGLAVSVT
jgi:predicted alpha/beta-hydrolase family hydrolase